MGGVGDDGGVTSVLLTPADLAGLQGAGAPVRVLDVRYRLNRPDGRPDHRAGHIPGAAYVDMDTELAAHGAPSDGRHPLPGRAALQAAARRWGISAGDTVVVYDDAGSVSAARAWWLLTRSGVADVRVLDGGLRAWTDAGLPLEQGDVRPGPGTIELAEITGALDIDEAAAWPARGVLLDARAPERYRGETEPYDPIAGHIPGARNLPASALMDGGRFRDAAELRAAFAAVGADGAAPVAAYCGSGVTAAHTALAGTIAGVDVAVYPGSWSQWSNTPGRPIATGD
jgi:thiosulfate/3-mercaptopyruvate sulfurtransferase